MTATIEPVRNAEYQDLLTILQDQQARKLDLVVPSSKMHFEGGHLIISGLPVTQELRDSGVTQVDPNGAYLPTKLFDEQLATSLDVPTPYFRRLRYGKTDARGKQTATPRLDVYDATANMLLGGRVEKRDFRSAEVVRPAIPADPRSVMVRLFRGDTTGTGIARCRLSNKAARLDNMDGLMAMKQGIEDAGIDPQTLRISGDLTETRMYVTVDAPEIIALAPKLLEGYRNPFSYPSERDRRQSGGLTPQQRWEAAQAYRDRGETGGGHHIYAAGEEPIVHAGFKLINSEVGQGKWKLVPFIKLLECSNGANFEKDIYERIHVGSRLDDGVMEWSAETQTAELTLVTLQTRDIVKKVLTADYVEAKVAELEGLAGKEIAEPEEMITVLSQKMKWSEDEQLGILRHFLMAGQSTTGGVLNAITSFSQTVADADRAAELDLKAVSAMEMAFALK